MQLKFYFYEKNLNNIKYYSITFERSVMIKKNIVTNK